MSSPDDLVGGGDSGGGGGAPAWILTFADLMSLLLAFFVLLFSFSSTDDELYKEIGGSMKDAFGVQTRYQLIGPPKGVNHIAQEFSSGRPDPKVLNVVPQLNLDVDKLYESSEEPGKSDMDADKEGHEEKLELSEDVEMKGLQDSETSSANQNTAVSTSTEKGKELGGQGEASGKEAAAVISKQDNQQKEQLDAEQKKKALAEAVAKSQTRALGEELASEISNGQLKIETKGSTIVIRINEQGSFPPGSAAAVPELEAVISKIGDTIKDTPGKVVVEGHTDNLPIDTTRYRSNWELSSARAATVVHSLLEKTQMPRKRFEVHGLADTQPISSNDSFQGRAENRRVEVVLEYDSLTTVPKDYKGVAEDYLRKTQPELFNPQNPASPEVLDRAFERSLQDLNIGPDRKTNAEDFIFQDSFFQ